MSFPRLFPSERLVYRPLSMEDLEVYMAMRHEATYRQWFYFQAPPTLESAAKEIRVMQEKASRKINLLKESFDTGVYLKESGSLIGTVSLNKFHGPEDELEFVEIGFGIGEAYQGNGYATEAAKTAVVWGLDRLRELGAVPVIEGNVEHANWPSRKVLEKAGFRLVRTQKYVTVYEIRSTSSGILGG
ncbi:GNAT family N-acetyltransferase [Paenibacillus mesotrionivorans]|uniref:GNAT family N-acetyltransferase n=1 Tax=Paenibacillus mesotrionivorans TaxID=3160968 RepID=A0ACC7NYQ6_9BACL